MQRRIAGSRLRDRIPFGRAALGLTLAAAAVALVPATAQADPGAVYFGTSGGTNCVLHDNGTFACGFGHSYNPPGVTMKIAGADIPIPFGVNQIAYDGSFLGTHPAFGSAGAYTRPGGNPDISTVATSQGQWGPVVEYGGTKCESGFHGSFTCTSQGHAFTTWMSNLSMG
ncbi:hypothetical protein [Nocardia nova]|uniref:hypothetical protein n=1 Tax=Nocardia nova TaxID=37330 RepID=UPI0033F917EE